MTEDRTPPEPLSEAESRDIERAKVAWADKKAGADWNGWLTIGHGLEVGRRQCMRDCHTNQPAGRAYNEAFGRWLRVNKLDDMDKKTRGDLFAIMGDLIEIEAWRKTLAENKRLQLNHPTAVLRVFRARVKDQAELARKATTAKSMHAALAALEEDRDKWKRRAETLEKQSQDGSLFTSRDSTSLIVDAIASELRTVTPTKFRDIVDKLNAACLQHAKTRKGKTG
jgi:hypothetical protein